MKSARAYIDIPVYDTPPINIGALFDMQNFEIRPGLRGESIISGGITFSPGIAGAENSFKSTLAKYMALTAFGQYQGHSRYTMFDTEGHAKISRDEMLAKRIYGLNGFDWYNEEGLYLFTQQAYVPGEVFYSNLIIMLKDKTSKDQIKESVLTSPMINRKTLNQKKPEGEKILEPDFILMDTATRFQTTSGMEIVEKNEIGSNATTSGNLKGSGDRNWVFSSINNFLLPNGGYFITTAHVGREFKMDKYEKSKKQLKDLTTGLQIKGAPQSYTSLTTDIWFVCESERLIMKDTKTPRYPRNSDENKLKDSPDLNILTIKNLRGKSGESGYPFKVVVSQSEGVKPELTNYHYLMESEYGMDGAYGGHHSLTLYPSVKLQRTTVRPAAESSYALGRALHITAELCWLTTHCLGWEDRRLLCTPTELYEDIKKLGYDWEELLSTTRYWWAPLELEPNIPYHYLSTIDLLKMRAGEYKPYWMNKK